MRDMRASPGIKGPARNAREMPVEPNFDHVDGDVFPYVRGWTRQASQRAIVLYQGVRGRFWRAAADGSARLQAEAF